LNTSERRGVVFFKFEDSLECRSRRRRRRRRRRRVNQ
jgi:hypothetical protein